MGIEQIPSWLGKEVKQSAKNLIQIRPYEDRKGFVGNTVDAGVDLAINMVKEPLRIATLAIGNIIGYTSSKILRLLGTTIQLGGKAAAHALRFPIPSGHRPEIHDGIPERTDTASRLQNLRVALGADVDADTPL
ncbi:MAG: hypothetical protein AAB489_04390 [Patescibacteria group bacterium]